MKFFLILLATSNLFFSSPLFATQSIKEPHVQIEWLAPKIFGPESTMVGIHFKIDPEWHVYWKNPGDSGAAPKFKVIAENATVGPIQWPYPHRLPIAHLTNLGYDKEVAYLFEVKPTGSSVQFEVKLEWLVCQEECIPGFGTLTLEEAVRKQAIWDPSVQKTLKEFQDRIPKPEIASPWKISSAQIEGEGLRVNVLPSSHEEIELYPLDGEFLSPAKPTRTKTDQGFEFIFKILSEKTPNHTGFVLVSNQRAWEFDSVPIHSMSSSSPDIFSSLWILVLTAFIAGILLNLMPCVFPVLSIKIFSLLKKHGGEPKSFKTRLRDGLSYSAGVILTFIALGGLFLGLRAAGTSVGWGFQLQSPEVILGLIVLFWLIALNFLGVFEFGYSVMNLAGKTEGWGSSFGTGVLSVFVAAPCTGPFMGSALGASVTLPAMQAITLFFALGTGLAAPFLLLALSPTLLSYLPKPGAWMERFKQFLAFPLFGTVLWLLWVLAQQVGEKGWVLGGIFLLVLSFSIWLFQSKNRLFKIIALILLLGTVILSFKKIDRVDESLRETQKENWIPYDVFQIESARAKKQAVFIDFTAAWCITCQVNKKMVLETEAVSKLFKERNVLTVKADWTNYNPIITEALSKFGRSSVPLYLFYPTDGSSPKILPQILTVSMIEELFK